MIDLPMNSIPNNPVFVSFAAEISNLICKLHVICKESSLVFRKTIFYQYFKTGFHEQLINPNSNSNNLIHLTNPELLELNLSKNEMCSTSVYI